MQPGEPVVLRTSPGVPVCMSLPAQVWPMIPMPASAATLTSDRDVLNHESLSLNI